MWLQAEQKTASEDIARENEEKRKIQTVNSYTHTYTHLLYIHIIVYILNCRQLRQLLSAQKEVESLSNELVDYWQVTQHTHTHTHTHGVLVCKVASLYASGERYGQETRSCFSETESKSRYAAYTNYIH